MEANNKDYTVVHLGLLQINLETFSDKLPNKDGKLCFELTRCILVHVTDSKKLSKLNGENKENEPVENGVSNGHSEADSINTGFVFLTMIKC